MRKKHSPRDDLLNELSDQFPGAKFDEGELKNRELKETVFLEKAENITENEEKIISSEMAQHPDFEILMEKYDAKVVEFKSSGDYIIVPDYKVIKKEKSGFFILRDKLKSLIKKY